MDNAIDGDADVEGKLVGWVVGEEEVVGRDDGWLDEEGAEENDGTGDGSPDNVGKNESEGLDEGAHPS